MRRLGRAEMSEAKSYKIESSCGTTIDTVPDGFEMAATAMLQADIICSKCKVSAL
jgi:hypothetical protein